MKVNGNEVTLSFKETGSGLSFQGKKIEGFELAGKDQNFYPAQAVIEKNNVVIKSDQVDHPVAVRFAFKNTSQVNLFNQEGWPVIPFRTDTW